MREDHEPAPPGPGHARPRMSGVESASHYAKNCSASPVATVTVQSSLSR
jgi:hypothetical protein